MLHSCVPPGHWIARVATTTACTLMGLTLCARVQAETVADLVGKAYSSIAPEALAEPGGTARAQALADLIASTKTLSPEQMLELRLDEAEAWLDAGKLDDVTKRLDAILHEPALTPALRERAGLTWIAAWKTLWRKADKPAEVKDLLSGLAGYGQLGTKVTAAEHTAQAEWLLAIKTPLDQEPVDKDLLAKQQTAILANFDAALGALTSEKPAERAPVYALRMLAMAELGKKPKEVQDYLLAHADDPAVAEVQVLAMTDSQKLVGQKAPALVCKRLDGTPGELNLTTYLGKPVLIDFFATWCAPCEEIATSVATAATHLAAKNIVTIGVSLDTKDTIGNLPAWITKHGISYPVIGEGLGWDGEAHKGFHVNAIPCLVLIGADGKVLSTSVDDGSTDQIEAAVAALLDPGAAPAATTPGPGAAPPAPGKPDATTPGFIP